MGSGRGGVETLRRGLRTVFFMLIMIGSLIIVSAPVFVAVADVLVPSVLLSFLSCKDCDNLKHNWKSYSFRSSLCDVPVISLVRSLVVVCVYSICDLPGLCHGLYLYTTAACSLISTVILAVKFCLFQHEIELVRATSSVLQSMHEKYSLCVPLLLLSSCLLAIAHIVVAYRTSCKARRKFLFHRVDPESVLSGKTVFHGYQKVPRSPTPNASKTARVVQEEKKNLYEERDVPARMLADADSFFLECEGLLIHYKIAYGDRVLGSLASRSCQYETTKGYKCVTPGRLRIENPLSIHTKNLSLSRSYSNGMTNASIHTPLLCDSVAVDVDTACSSVFDNHSGSTQSIPELNLEDYNTDSSSNSLNPGMGELKKNGIDAIILIHGFGGGVFSWRHVMGPLARQTGCPVVAFDRPGWGLTSRPRRSDWEEKKMRNPYEIESQIDLLYSFCHQMGFSSVVLVGHDDGGLLTMMAAEKANTSRNCHQVEVKGIVLVGVSLTREVVPGFAKILLHTSLGKHMLRPLLRTEISQVANRRAWYDATKLTSDVLDLYKAPLCVEGWDNALSEVSKLSSNSVISVQNATQLVQNLKGLPVLVAAGAEDILVPLKSAHVLATKIANSTLIPISGCGHLPHEECPKALLAALIPFVSKLHKISQKT